MINKLHLHLDVPVTAKIRILETKEKTLEYARNVLRAGASILTVHGRQREQKGHKTGLADWSVIRYLREQLPTEAVLFANGNILRREDIDRCLEVTGADGVMSAEGNLYDPSIFSVAPEVGSEGREYWRGRDGRGGWRMDAVCRRYMDILYKYVLEFPIPQRKPLYLPTDPEEEVTVIAKEESKEEEEGPPKKKQRKEKKEKTTSPNLLAMQPHLFHLLRPLVAKHHHIRDALARCRAGDIAAFENVSNMVDQVVAEGIKQYEASDGKSWEEELAKDERLKELKKDEVVEGEKDEEYESSLEMVKACKRPWWVVQPYVRPLPKEALAKGSLTLSKKDKAKREKEKEVEGKVAIPNGHTQLEKIGDGKETVEVPKEGLVCG